LNSYFTITAVQGDRKSMRACWILELTHLSFSFVVLCQAVPLAWKHKRADPQADVAYYLPY